MRNPNELLELLRQNTCTFPRIDLPENVVQRITYLKSLTTYNSELANEIAESVMLNPVSDDVLAELLGRYKTLHYFLNRLDGLDLNDVTSIREEVRKRKDIRKRLDEILCPDHVVTWSDMKVLMSGLARIIIEAEKKPEMPASLMEVFRMVFTSVDANKWNELDCNLLRFLFLGGSQ